MAQSIYMSSDFQDAGIAGNLKKLEDLVKQANSDDTAVGLSLAGDLGDLHALELPEVAEEIQHISNSLLQQSGFDIKDLEEATQKLVDKYKTIDEIKKAMSEKTLTEEDLNQLQKNQEYGQKLKEVSGHATMQFLNHYVYAPQAERLTSLRKGIQTIGVLGNNDTLLAKKTLADKVRFLDDQKDTMNLGKGITIIGANYTNFDNERAIPQELGGLIIDDSPDIEKSEIYKRFKGKRPNLIVVHDSPNGISSKFEQAIDKKPVVGFRTYLDEIKDKKIVVLQSGHSGHAGLFLYKNMRGTLILNVNTNNKGPSGAYAKAKFNDEGDFESVEMYRMAA